MRFVVQEHWARHHHYDFRLELNGVLKSWAVPKGLPAEKGVRRLAVQVEDHEISYIDFEGTIEEGYGKGSVKIYDSGEYELKERNDEKFVVVLKGRKLNGEYVIMHWKERNWLMFRTG